MLKQLKTWFSTWCCRFLNELYPDCFMTWPLKLQSDSSWSYSESKCTHFRVWITTFWFEGGWGGVVRGFGCSTIGYQLNHSYAEQRSWSNRCRSSALPVLVPSILDDAVGISNAGIVTNWKKIWNEAGVASYRYLRAICLKVLRKITKIPQWQDRQCPGRVSN
jgi:hypothetical protein